MRDKKENKIKRKRKREIFKDDIKSPDGLNIERKSILKLEESH